MNTKKYPSLFFGLIFYELYIYIADEIINSRNFWSLVFRMLGIGISLSQVFVVVLS